MKTRLLGRKFETAAILAMLLILIVQPKEGRSEEGLREAPASNLSTTSTAGESVSSHLDIMRAQGSIVPTTNRDDTPTLSPNVKEILKMVDAKVSPEVIKVYVEGAAIETQPTAEDIVVLKAHGVGDDITTALLKRSAEIRAQTQQAAVDAASAASPETAGRPGRVVYVRSRPLDPESYEYFQYYYLHPRTLASVYQRLSPHYPHYFGYNPPPMFAPHFHGRHAPYSRGFSHYGGSR